MERTAASRRGLLAACLLVVLLFAGLAPTPAQANPTLERRMLRLTNASRHGHDLPRLDLARARSDRARRHSVRMARHGGLYHTSAPTEAYLRGVLWQRWGENVGNTGSGSDLRPLQHAFMASPEHRANVLDPGFRRVAIGVVKRGGQAWVTLFFYG